MYYFAYGTTQHGLPHHRDALGEPLGRFRTVDPYAIVVPREAACSNPGCSLVHRMAVLIPWDDHAEGDVFALGDDLLQQLDELELSGPYTRTTLTVTDGSRQLHAHAYPAREPARWAALVHSGRADALLRYPLELATSAHPKPCCERNPGHPPPHDIIDPL